MAKLQFTRNGGQSIMDTIRESDTQTVRKMLLAGKADKKTLIEILSPMSPKDQKHARELLIFDTELAALMGEITTGQDLVVEQPKPRVINITKLREQERQREEQLQQEQLAQRVDKLKDHFAA